MFTKLNIKTPQKLMQYFKDNKWEKMSKKRGKNYEL